MQDRYTALPNRRQRKVRRLPRPFRIGRFKPALSISLYIRKEGTDEALWQKDTWCTRTKLFTFFLTRFVYELTRSAFGLARFARPLT